MCSIVMEGKSGTQSAATTTKCRLCNSYGCFLVAACIVPLYLRIYKDGENSLQGCWTHKYPKETATVYPKLS